MSSDRRSFLKGTGLSLGLGGVLGGASTSASADHETQLYPYRDRFIAADDSNYTTASREAWDIDWIVVHLTVGTDGSAINWFQDPSSDVSAHYVVSSYDSTTYPAGDVTQMVYHKDIAWHARGANSSSIGIEIEWHPDYGPVTAAAYDSVAQLISWLSTEFSIPCAIRSNDYFDGATPWCDYDGGIIAHRDCPNCSTCACYDTIDTRCPDPDGFDFDTLQNHLNNYC